VKIGGLGPVEGFKRPTVEAKKSEALRASDSLLSSSGPSRSQQSESSSTKSEKDFSSILSKKTTQPKPAPKLDDRNEQTESLAGASMTAQPTPISADRNTPVESANEPSIETASSETRSSRSRQQYAPDLKSPETGSDAAAIESGEISQKVIDQVLGELAADLSMASQSEEFIRSSSMQDFLSQMKSEFGIQPEAVIKAFANLSPAALEASPEESAQELLSGLGLKPDQMPKAERMYREMLNVTGESALNETMAGIGAGVTMKVLSEQEVALEKLQKSITILNDSFAIRSPASDPTVIPLDNAMADAGTAAVEITVPSQAKRDVGTSLKEALEAKDASAPKGQMTSELGVVSVLAASSAGASMMNGKSSGDRQASQNPDRNLSSPSSDKKLETIESALRDAGFAIPTTSEKSATPLAAGTSTALANAMMSQSDESSMKANAQDVVRNAQLLLRSGGGEMKMQLKPEGVGEIHLKVVIKDGHVAVQMLTESDSAKKLLENGIEDLKTSLAQNKLHVDALKIEVGTEMAKQRFEQSQQESGREQARQLAQDFLGSFRQDRESFRQGFADQSGFRSYGQPRRPTPPEMEQVASNSSLNKEKNSRRLDLVA
jgi:flagellar hook-length control protein FliK